MDNVAEFLELHEVVDLDGGRLADSVDVVSREIDQHDVLGAVFLRCQELSAEGLVLCKAHSAKWRSALDGNL